MTPGRKTRRPRNRTFSLRRQFQPPGHMWLREIWHAANWTDGDCRQTHILMLQEVLPGKSKEMFSVPLGHISTPPQTPASPPGSGPPSGVMWRSGADSLVFPRGTYENIIHHVEIYWRLMCTCSSIKKKKQNMKYTRGERGWFASAVYFTAAVCDDACFAFARRPLPTIHDA